MKAIYIYKTVLEEVAYLVRGLRQEPT